VLLMTAGHVHPGGLWTDLYLDRGTDERHIFRSVADYFDPNGPVSWDMSMTATPADWMVQVRKGDRLRLTATYDTELASWYESMGIMLVYIADGDFGHDPFKEQVKTTGEITHGHLAAAGNHGGAATTIPDPAKRPNGQTIANGIAIAGFKTMPGDLSEGGVFGAPPMVPTGGRLRFGNFDSSAQIFHTVTACREPCTATTGVSFPLANGDVEFDSGQLGYGPGGFTAAAERSDWYTPSNLPAGTYTYFCRVHPFMRGAFRVPGTVAPRELQVPAGRAGVDRSGRVRINAACGGRKSGACEGTVELRRRGALLGAASFVIPAGTSREVTITLSKRGQALLRKSRSLPVTLVAQAKDSPAVSHTLVLRRR
jgi:plastocyanin